MRPTRRLLVATATAVALGLSGPVLAQEGGGEPGPVTHSWAVSPAGDANASGAGNRLDFSYELNPGDQVDDAITVHNLGTAQLTFRLYPTDALNNEQGEFDLLPGDEEPTDVGTWVDVEQGNLTVPSGMEVTLPIKITVPAEATPGDHVGAILASNAAQGTGPDGSTVTLDRRTGVRIYIRVAGPLRPDLTIENVSTSYTPALNPLGGTTAVSYRIANQGNVRLSGAHSVSVSGPFGIARKRVPAKDLPELLPGEDVTLEATFDGVPALGVLSAEVRLDPTGTDADALETSVRTGWAIAPPITLVLLAVAIWLARRSRRAYRRHRRDDRPSRKELPTREPQLT